VAIIRLKAGQQYRTAKEIEAICMISYRAPYTGGENVTLPIGFEFEIMHDPPRGATGTGCAVVEYDKYQEILVPKTARSCASYAGYYLVIMFEQIEGCCELLTNAT